MALPPGMVIGRIFPLRSCRDGLAVKYRFDSLGASGADGLSRTATE